MQLLVTTLIAFVALTVLFFGPLVVLPAVGMVEGGWRFAALGAAVAGCAGVMWGLYRVADRRTAPLEGLRGRAPRDRLFCQRCGAEVAPGTVVCGVCGGTRLGLAAPADTAGQRPAVSRGAPSGPAPMVNQGAIGRLWRRGR
jgi:hypothetical protein